MKCTLWLIAAAAVLLGAIPRSLAADSIVTGFYSAELQAWPNALNRFASGYSELTTFANETAYLKLVLYNMHQFLQVHIHGVLGNNTSISATDAPIGVWLYPKTNESDYEVPIGSGPYEDVPLISGSLVITETFGAEDLVFPRISGVQNWSDFQALLNTPFQKTLYINAHTVNDPNGNLLGYYNATTPTIEAVNRRSQLPVLPAPTKPLSSPDIVSYSVANLTSAVVNGPASGASGFFAITTFTNQTALAEVVLNNITEFTMAHIHMITDTTTNTGPVVVWLFPATTNPNFQSPLGTANLTSLLPLTGNFEYQVQFNASLLQFENPTTWEQFVAMLTSTTAKLYLNVHSVQNPVGEISGLIKPASMPPSLGSPALQSPPSLGRRMLLQEDTMSPPSAHQSPMLSSPELRSPALMSPELMSPELMSPQLKSPELLSPPIASPVPGGQEHAIAWGFYTALPKNITAVVGDKLVFSWSGPIPHNVAMITAPPPYQYPDVCSETYIVLGATSPVSVPLNATGTYIFVCKVHNHCSAYNMAQTVIVMGRE